MPNATQHAKIPKASLFHSIAAKIQSSRSLQMPQYLNFSILLSLATSQLTLSFSFSEPSYTHVHVFHSDNKVLCSLHKQTVAADLKKGGECRLFKFSLEQTPALQTLEDVDQSCKSIQAPLCPVGIGSPHELELEGNTCQGDCCVFVFGLMWSPEDFVKQAVSVGHPFSCFQGCQRESRALVCVWQRVTHMAYNNRCSKLGEWLHLSKSFEVEEAALSLPCRKRGDEFWRGERYAL